jgi:glycine cleavage system H protein
MYPTEYLYSEDHEWLHVEEDTCRIGITEFAQKQLGDVVFVELPEVGTTFIEHDSFGTVESVKAVAEVFTPVAGEVVEANRALDDRPELINEDPHGDGWLIILRLAPGSDLSTLMDADAYQQFVDKEAG